LTEQGLGGSFPLLHLLGALSFHVAMVQPLFGEMVFFLHSPTSLHINAALPNTRYWTIFQEYIIFF
jgi:hypothetical protein